MKAMLRFGLPAFLIVISLTTAFGQARGPGAEFVITKITKNLITLPNFAYTGAQQYRSDQRDMWLEMEVEFSSALEWTDELTFKYYVLFNGKILTGEVTHTNIPGGRDNRSVMYVAPRTLARFGNNRAVTANMVQNIAVQILQQGAVKSELSLQRAPPQWFASIPQTAGFVLNKNETPFAALYWDRYQQIKSAR